MSEGKLLRWWEPERAAGTLKPCPGLSWPPSKAPRFQSHGLRKPHPADSWAWAPTWSCCPVAIALQRNDEGLVQRDPKLHLAAQPLEEHVGIVFEALHDSLVLPATDILEGLGQVPVVNGHL